MSESKTLNEHVESGRRYAYTVNLATGEIVVCVEGVSGYFSVLKDYQHPDKPALAIQANAAMGLSELDADRIVGSTMRDTRPKHTQVLDDILEYLALDEPWYGGAVPPLRTFVATHFQDTSTPERDPTELIEELSRFLLDCGNGESIEETCQGLLAWLKEDDDRATAFCVACLMYIHNKEAIN